MNITSIDKLEDILTLYVVGNLTRELIEKDLENFEGKIEYFEHFDDVPKD